MKKNWRKKNTQMSPNNAKNNDIKIETTHKKTLKTTQTSENNTKSND